MKTKEIDVWFLDMDGCVSIKELVKNNDEHEFTLWNYDIGSDGFMDGKVHKAKLVIEIPDQKITISESEFDIIVGKKKVIDALNYNKIKKELGFKVDE
jgi:hypothetical protein